MQSSDTGAFNLDLPLGPATLRVSHPDWAESWVEVDIFDAMAPIRVTLSSHGPREWGSPTRMRGRMMGPLGAGWAARSVQWFGLSAALSSLPIVRTAQ